MSNQSEEIKDEIDNLEPYKKLQTIKDKLNTLKDYTENRDISLIKEKKSYNLQLMTLTY